MITPSFFAVLPADVRYDAALTPQEKILYAEISALTNSRGYCWAGNKYFARLYGRNETYISHVINNLAKKGYINIETEIGGSKGGSDRVILLPKKYFIPPAPALEKPDVAQINPLAALEKPKADSLYSSNNNTKEHWSFFGNDLLAHFSRIWEKYPLKLKKKEAFTHFKASVKTEQDVKDIEKALENYLLHLSLKKNAWKHPQQGKTWFNSWHEWITWQEPETTAELQSRHKKLDGLISRALDISKVAFMQIDADEFEHVKDELMKQREQALRNYKLLCVELKGVRHDDYYKPEIVEKILRRAADVDKGD